MKSEGLNKNVGGRKKDLLGSEYRQRPRDRLERRKVKGPELFGIARQINQEESVVFKGLLLTVPRLSNYRIEKSKVSDNPSLKLLNRGQVRSALERSSKKKVEPKDLRRWEEEILDSVNGRGSSRLTLSAKEFEPETFKLRGKSIGSLVVSSESPHYDQLAEANEIALNGLKHENRADSSDRRGSLLPRIDLIKHPNQKAVSQTIDYLGQLLVENEALIILEPARGYRVAS